MTGVSAPPTALAGYALSRSRVSALRALIADADMTDIPRLEPGCGSWIIVDRQHDRPVRETFDREVAETYDRDRYEVLTAMQWLKRFNARLASCDENPKGEDRLRAECRSIPARSRRRRETLMQILDPKTGLTVSIDPTTGKIKGVSCFRRIALAG